MRFHVKNGFLRSKIHPLFLGLVISSADLVWYFTSKFDTDLRVAIGRVTFTRSVYWDWFRSRNHFKLPNMVFTEDNTNISNVRDVGSDHWRFPPSPLSVLSKLQMDDFIKLILSTEPLSFDFSCHLMTFFLPCPCYFATDFDKTKSTFFRVQVNE